MRAVLLVLRGEAVAQVRIPNVLVYVVAMYDTNKSGLDPVPFYNCTLRRHSEFRGGYKTYIRNYTVCSCHGSDFDEVRSEPHKP